MRPPRFLKPTQNPRRERPCPWSWSSLLLFPLSELFFRPSYFREPDWGAGGGEVSSPTHPEQSPMMGRSLSLPFLCLSALGFSPSSPFLSIRQYGNAGPSRETKKPSLLLPRALTGFPSAHTNAQRPTPRDVPCTRTQKGTPSIHAHTHTGGVYTTPPHRRTLAKDKA